MVRWIQTLVTMLLVWSSVPAVAQEMHAGAPPVQVQDEAPVVPADWQQVEGTWLRVYGPDDELPTLMAVARDGSVAVQALATELGVPIGGTIHVVVAPTSADFYALQPGVVPEWADGTAWPTKGQIYLRRQRTRQSDRPLDQVMRHELVHILLGRAFAPAHPPAWLQEGTATLLSGEYGPDMSRRLIQATATGYEPSLAALDAGFPSDLRRAGLAYAESADFLSFMVGTYGDDTLQRLVREGASGAPLPAAIRAVTGEFMEDVEPAWRRRFRTTGLAWTGLLSSWEGWTGIAGVFAAVGLVLARRRGRKRLRDMRDQEERLDTLLRALSRDVPVMHG